MNEKKTIQSALNGDVNAMLRLGEYYSNQEFEEQEEAIRWYEEAAKRGSVEGALKAAQLRAEEAILSEKELDYRNAYFSWKKSGDWAKSIVSPAGETCSIDIRTENYCWDLWEESVFGCAICGFHGGVRPADVLSYLDLFSKTKRTKEYLLEGYLKGVMGIIGEDPEFSWAAQKALRSLETDDRYVQSFNSFETRFLEQVLFKDAVLCLSELYYDGIPGRSDPDSERACALLKNVLGFVRKNEYLRDKIEKKLEGYLRGENLGSIASYRTETAPEEEPLSSIFARDVSQFISE